MALVDERASKRSTRPRRRASRLRSKMPRVVVQVGDMLFVLCDVTRHHGGKGGGHTGVVATVAHKHRWFQRAHLTHPPTGHGARGTGHTSHGGLGALAWLRLRRVLMVVLSAVHDSCSTPLTCCRPECTDGRHGVRPVPASSDANTPPFQHQSTRQAGSLQRTHVRHTVPHRRQLGGGGGNT